MLSRLLTPFSSRNYRLYFFGQFVSLVGSWMTQTATVWLVYHLTESPLWLGLVGFLSQAPTIVLGPLAGVWVDRLDRLKLLIGTQALSMGQSLLLAYFTFAGSINIWILTALAMLQGFINAFDMPTRQSLAVLLVERREHLSGVIGMNASMFNLARLTGPAIGGFVIAAFGTAFCFLIDGLSYLAVLAAILAMRLNLPPPAVPSGSVWAEMRDGFAHAFGFRPIRALILFTGAIGTFGISSTVLIPVYAKETFGGSAQTLGWLMSSSAAGSVLAALYLAARRGLSGIGTVIAAGGVLAGCALLGFAWSTRLPLSVVCLLLFGFGAVLVFASINTLLQNLVDEDKRGRVMSIYSVAFLGGLPLGGLMTGALADAIGAPAATRLNAGACIILALVFYRMLPRLRGEARPALERAGALHVER